MTGLRLGFGLTTQRRGVAASTFDYYVDSVAGNNSNDGLTRATAKQTLAGLMSLGAALVNKSAGLKRGSTFSETLTIDRAGMTFGVYGSGAKPIVSSNGADGIRIRDVSNIEVSGLEIVGNGKTTNSGHGVDLAVTAAVRKSNILLQNLVVRGFGLNGINVQGRSTVYGFDGVTISGCEVYDCTENYTGNAGSAGIYVWTATGYGLAVNTATHTNVTISACNVHDCNGKAAAGNWTGSGIVIAETDGGLIDRCIVSKCGANSNFATGPVGQWCYDSKNVIIRNGVVTEMHVGSGTDGGGFDIDGGCQNCVIEYCQSSDCDGPGILLCAYYDQTNLLDFTGNVARYNTSTNDGKVSTNKAVLVIGNDHGFASFRDVSVHDNTFTFTGSEVTGLKVTGAFVDTIAGSIHDNSFITTNGILADVLRLGSLAGLDDNVYQTSGTPSFKYRGSNYASLATWLAALATPLSPANLFSSPSDISNAYWTKANLTVTEAVADDVGGTAAEGLRETVTNGNHSHARSVTKSAGAANYEVRFKWKGVNRTRLAFFLFNADFTGGAVGYVYSATPRIDVIGYGGMAKAFATIAAIGNGYFECSIIARSDGGTTLPIYFYQSNADTGISYTGVVANGSNMLEHRLYAL